MVFLNGHSQKGSKKVMEYISYRLPKGSLLYDTMEYIRIDWSDLVHELKPLSIRNLIMESRIASNPKILFDISFFLFVFVTKLTCECTMTRTNLQ